jgi:hypothetical protein
MSHIDTVEYIWPFEHLPEAFIEFWRPHFEFLDPGYDGLRVDVEYSYRPGRPGKFDGKPENCYPAEDHELEVLSTVASVMYSSPGAKANHLDAYPSKGCDTLTCAGASEFCTALLGAWEAWLESPLPGCKKGHTGLHHLEEWLLEKAVDTEKSMAEDAAIALHEARMARHDDPSYL